MSRVKQLVQIINGCEKKEFDKIVESYLKNIYGFERVIITDGKDDVGIDIKVFDAEGKNIQYQLTIQKSGTVQEKNKLKTKIFEDVVKANINAEQYGYSNNLYFFYSYELTNKVKREYKKEALIKYNINLEIIDANQIAEEAEEYIDLQQIIYGISGLDEFKLKKSLFEDKNRCLMYDLVSFGKCSDLKLEIVEVYILQCLFEKGPLTTEEISACCKNKFFSKENPTFYSKLINKLYATEKKLTYSKETKCYSLTEEEKEIINRRTNQIKLDETSFISEIGSILKQYNQENHIDEYVKLLTELYTDALSKRIEVKQYLEDSDNVHLNKIISYGNKQLKAENTDAKLMISQLIQVCDENKYLQKTCASYIFSSKIGIDNLEKYASERKQVYIDTSVALNILCLYYKKTDYKDYNYQLSQSLSEYCKKNNIKLFLTERYLWEVTGHVREALGLIPFTKIQNFNLLGKSRNIFYNYYRHLEDVNLCELTFGEFLEDFGFRSSDWDNTEKLNQTITSYLSQIGVEVVPIPRSYDIESLKKTMEIILSEMDRFKTSFAIENDCITLKYLGDPDVEIHNIDPVFITWDKSLYKILKDLYRDNPLLKKWMQFTPGQYIDRHSLLSFSINSESISQEMLAILSGDIVQHTMSLLDSLSLILNPNGETTLEYTKRFTKMKESQIYTIDKIPKEDNDGITQDPIDYVVYRITSSYRNIPEEYIKLKELFSIKECVEDVINIINNSVDYYKNYNTFDKKTKSYLDELIIKHNLQKKMTI
jgi:hypothetical protein